MARARSPREAAARVVYDVDCILRIAPLRRQWGRLRALRFRGPRDRRSQLGMQRVMRMVAESEPEVDVFFVTGLPIQLARPLLAALRHDQYPTGTALMAGRGLFSGWLFGAGLSRKRATLDRLAQMHPDTSWVLVGDDAGHDPLLFAGFSRDHPGRVAAVALRRLIDVGGDQDQTDREESDEGSHVVAAPNGEELCRCCVGRWACIRRRGASPSSRTGSSPPTSVATR